MYVYNNYYGKATELLSSTGNSFTCYVYASITLNINYEY